MKELKRTGRHRAEVWENGVKIDYAVGRNNVINMKERHWPKNEQPTTESQQTKPMPDMQAP